MNEFHTTLQSILTPTLHRCVLSGPTPAAKYKKVAIRRVGARFQLEQYTQTQVFHAFVEPEALLGILGDLLGREFRHFHGWDEDWETSLRLSKKGKPMVSRTAAGGTVAQGQGHDREKRRILAEGVVVPPLVDMGVYTAEGKVVRGMYDKYKQINRFLELLEDAVEGLEGPLHLVDFGCGKSYLTFIVYDYFTRVKGMAVSMVGLDLKADVIDKCNRAAMVYGYEGLRFRVGDIREYQPEAPVDVVISLHACDVATDFALRHAVGWGAKVILAVPCCQHELAGQVQGEALGLMTRYGIVKERFAALMTDAIRANLLEVAGYKTQVLEFVDLAHTPKNLLIRAVKRPRPGAVRAAALREAREAMDMFGLEPTLYTLLREDGVLTD